MVITTPGRTRSTRSLVLNGARPVMTLKVQTQSLGRTDFMLRLLATLPKNSAQKSFFLNFFLIKLNRNGLL